MATHRATNRFSAAGPLIFRYLIRMNRSCPYGIDYRSVLRIIRYGLFAKPLRIPLRIKGLWFGDKGLGFRVEG